MNIEKNLSEIEESIERAEKKELISDVYILPEQLGNVEEVDILPDEIDSGSLEQIGCNENKEKKGGSYSEVFKEGEGNKYEVHHMPANSASYLDLKDGPAIKMEKEDHRKTASCGSSRDAREYQAIQKELIDKGKLREDIQKEIDDIREKFGDKYEDAIADMLAYVVKLEQEG